MSPRPPYRPPEPGDEVREAKPGEEVCDFCSNPEVRWSYPAHGTYIGDEIPTPGGPLLVGSPDDWAACDQCHRRIERGDRAGLARRAAKRYQRKYGLPAGLTMTRVQQAIREAHDSFWAAREGAPEPFRRSDQ